ncbi:MAG: hypothetical protein AAF682_10455 [Planctomycetota bacterium]
MSVRTTLAPGLLLLAGCAAVRTVDEARHDLEKSVAFWHEQIEPRLGHLEQLVHTAEADVQRASALWQNDVEPRLAKLEKLVASVESKVESELHKAVVAWHKEVEGHLQDLERAAQADAESLRKDYRGLLVDLRSIKVRVESDVTKSALVKHVRSLVDHVKELEQKHAAGMTGPDVEAMRSKIEGDVSELLKKL